MTCRLSTAGRLPEIGTHLLKQIEDRLIHEAIDLFTPLTIHVSDRMAGEWLRLHLLTGLNGRADLRFDTIEHGLRRLVTPPEEQLPAALTAEQIADLILSLLLDPDKDLIEPLAPVWIYLYGTPRPGLPNDQSRPTPTDPACTAWWRRAWSLSETLAGLFLRYENAQPGEVFAGTEAKDHASWQALIYQTLFKSGGRRDRCFPGRTTLRQSVRASSAELRQQPPSSGHPPIFIFTSPPSPLETTLLLEHSAASDLEVYLLTPGLDDLSEKALGMAETGHEPPQIWNTPIRTAVADLVRSVSETPRPIAHVSLDTQPASPQGFLHRLQYRLAHPSRSDDASRHRLDRSLQVFACPGSHREAETIAQLILGRLAEKSYSFNDVAVLYTDPAIVPMIREVFQTAGIPLAGGLAPPFPGPSLQGSRPCGKSPPAVSPVAPSSAFSTTPAGRRPMEPIRRWFAVGWTGQSSSASRSDVLPRTSAGNAIFPGKPLARSA